MEKENYWNSDIYKINSETNLKNVQYTIDDLDISGKKIMICGKGSSSHPNFFPRFSTPSTNMDSNLYVLVDHTKGPLKVVTRKGDYALSLVVDPLVAKKILNLGGKIFWFSPEYIKCNLPKIISGKFPIGNSGLAAISIAAHLKTQFILLSGIKLTGKYQQFIESKEVVFKNISESNTRIFSLDGVLTEKISLTEWRDL